MFQLSILKKFGMELQCSKNEMVQTNVLKILFIFYSSLSSPLTLSLSSLWGWVFGGGAWPIFVGCRR